MRLASGLQGRVAVVTGAGGGVGGETMRRLAAAGALVVACDIKESALEAALRALPGADQHAGIVGDVALPTTVDRIVETAERRFGRLDILVNAAAVHLRLPFSDIDEAAWQRYMDTNVKSQFFLSRRCATAMIRRSWGRIINFSSVGAQTGGADPETSVVYAATKGAVLAMTRSLARLLAPNNILVNTIAPGGVRTPMASTLDERAINRFEKAVPLGRLAEPGEIADAAVFLASDHASYITGAVLDVNGGLYMR